MFPGGKGGRCVGLTTLLPSCADCLEIWEPQPPGTIWACPGLSWNCFTFTENQNWFPYWVWRKVDGTKWSVWVYLMSLVQGDVQCSGRTLDIVRSQSAYGLICCIYLFETVNSEVKRSSNCLCGATVSDNCGKTCKFQNLYQYNSAVSTNNTTETSAT